MGVAAVRYPYRDVIGIEGGGQNGALRCAFGRHHLWGEVRGVELGSRRAVREKSAYVLIAACADLERG